ncbi:MAG: SPOR domain-containing protein [Maritimibacter sp.]
MHDADWGSYPAAYSHESHGQQHYRSAGQSPYVHPAHGGAAQPASYGYGGAGAASYGYQPAAAQAYGTPPPYGQAGMPGGAPENGGDPKGGAAFARIINGAGAVLSVALIAGLAVWGYQLAVRDVTGVPVVRALEGPMRVQPEDPGGVHADYQGLAVNDVAAGIEEAPTEEVALAPAPMELSEEDQPVTELALADTEATDAASLSDGDILAMVNDMTDGIEPLSATLDDSAASTDTVAAVPGAHFETIPSSVPGVTHSPRPKARPVELVARAATSPVELAVASATTATTPDFHDVAITDVASGTRLVQLGAYDSIEVANAEWNRIMERFSDVFVGKDRVVEKAQSGGKTFYRLRAMNFADLPDARQFCAALIAGSAACIPVVAR